MECSIEQRSMAHREPSLGPAPVRAKNFGLHYNTAQADLCGMGDRGDLLGCVPAGKEESRRLGEWVGRVPLPGGRQAGQSEVVRLSAHPTCGVLPLC